MTTQLFFPKVFCADMFSTKLVILVLFVLVDLVDAVDVSFVESVFAGLALSAAIVAAIEKVCQHDAECDEAFFNNMKTEVRTLDEAQGQRVHGRHWYHRWFALCGPQQAAVMDWL